MIIQPNEFSCLATSFAMVLEVDIDYVFKFCGHDGSEVVPQWRDTRKPGRAFHLQEMFDLCFDLGRRPTPIERMPCSRNRESNSYHYVPTKANRFTDYLNKFDGVLLDNKHAVAWIDNQVHDPVGLCYPLFSELTYHTFIIVD